MSTVDLLDQKALRGLRQHLGAEAANAEAVGAALRASGRLLGSASLQELTRSARAELAGAGPLQPLLDLPGACDVVLNGPSSVWVDRGRGLERAALDLGTPAAVRALAARLAALAGQRLDDAQPICDGALPDGTRLHAVIAPLVSTSAGAAISLRLLRQSTLDLPALLAGGTIPPAWESLLRGIVSRRANTLISGGTGSGKTTLLSALLALVPPTERVITVEESPELAPPHPHIVSLVARQANVEGAGRVPLADLVRATLRMRPDRIVVGECRGGEVREMLLAMNTGHDGCLATVHANAVGRVPARLEALAALAGMTRAAVAAQAVAALDLVIHLRRSGGRHFIEAVGPIERSPDGFAAPVAACWAGQGQVEVIDQGTMNEINRRWLS
ncbi:MAG: TadA family conjugal transfer-associated ATPase [Promicromonosporaceae bacterium]|nr:TadA family conjugal transfer-associated ATPase [Promicromonosporaceae bacterium]